MTSSASPHGVTLAHRLQGGGGDETGFRQHDNRAMGNRAHQERSVIYLEHPERVVSYVITAQTQVVKFAEAFQLEHNLYPDCSRMRGRLNDSGLLLSTTSRLRRWMLQQWGG